MRTSAVPLILAVLALAPARSEAGLIVVTSGPTIKHIGEISADQKLGRNPLKQGDPRRGPVQVLGFGMANPAVGFHYQNFGVFWIEIWTWGGSYCVYEGKRAQKITPEMAAQLLGKEVGDLPTPFTYRFPPGLLIIGAIVVISIPVAILARRRESQTQATMADPRYQHAIQLYQQGNQSEAAFEEAIVSLEREGIPHNEAVRNLRALLGRLGQREQQVG